MTDQTPQLAESDERPARVEIHVETPKPRPLHPCELGKHRWAWLTNGRQACGYCGRPR